MNESDKETPNLLRTPIDPNADQDGTRQLGLERRIVAQALRGVSSQVKVNPLVDLRVLTMIVPFPPMSSLIPEGIASAIAQKAA